MEYQIHDTSHLPEKSFQSQPVVHRQPAHSSTDQTLHHLQTRRQYQHLLRTPSLEPEQAKLYEQFKIEIAHNHH